MPVQTVQDLFKGLQLVFGIILPERVHGVVDKARGVAVVLVKPLADRDAALALVVLRDRFAGVPFRHKVVDLVGGVRLGYAERFGKLRDRRAAEQIDHVHGVGLRSGERAGLLPDASEHRPVCHQA